MLFQSINSGNSSPSLPLRLIPNIKILILTALLALASTSQDIRMIMAQSLADAYLQVTVFVAATLFVFYFLESRLNFNVFEFFQRHKSWQVPIAAFLGMLPGCGGAIIVITKYLRGGLSFGAVVAVLISTMGDAAFLLLAQSPSDAIAVFACSLVVGIVSGYIVDAIHGSAFLRPQEGSAASEVRHVTRRVDSKLSQSLWALPFIPGVFIGIAIAFQLDKNISSELFGVDAILWVGVFGSLISLAIWTNSSATKPIVSDPISKKNIDKIRDEDKSSIGCIFGRVLGDTVFVTAWVILAFLTYELGIHFSGFNLESLLLLGEAFVPLIAILVGFIPGCGPQLMVCSLYLNGVLPFSAEIGNAISNDGDALFPAIALAPKVAIIATLYSAVPAIVIAYSYYWLFE